MDLCSEEFLKKRPKKVVNMVSLVWINCAKRQWGRLAEYRPKQGRDETVRNNNNRNKKAKSDRSGNQRRHSKHQTIRRKRADNKLAVHRVGTQEQQQRNHLTAPRETSLHTKDVTGQNLLDENKTRQLEIPLEREFQASRDYTVRSRQKIAWNSFSKNRAGNATEMASGREERAVQTEGSRKHEVQTPTHTSWFLQRTWVWFPPLTWQPTTICDSRSGGSSTVF